MAENDGYNGWANYPTWDVHLWLTNEEDSYAGATHLVAHAGSIRQAADAQRAWVEEGNPLTGEASLYADILGWALELVDWDEVAAALAPQEDHPRQEGDSSSDISSQPPQRGN